VAVHVIMTAGLQSMAALAGHSMTSYHTSSSLRATPTKNLLNQVSALACLKGTLHSKLA